MTPTTTRDTAPAFATPIVAMIGLVLLAGSPGLASAESSDWNVPSYASRLSNPVPPTDESLSRGAALYAQQCAVCHGLKGRGDGAASAALSPRPARLDSRALCDQSDGALLWKIEKGRAPMPSFGTLLDRNQRADVVNFLRSLAAKTVDGDCEAPDSARPTEDAGTQEGT